VRSKSQVILLLTFACVSAPTPPRTRPGQEIVIQAERNVWCGPGWKGTITSTVALQQVDDTCVHPRQYTRRVAVNMDQWRAVLQALDDSEFQSLPEDITTPMDSDGKIEVVTDDDHLCIQVDNDHRSHKVCGHEWPLSRTSEGANFLRVWHALTAILPEPSN
jgi:hypothetical protein